MPSESPAAEAAPKTKRRGRPPGVKARKRHDQADTDQPIDGDWAKDVVLNKDPSRSYAWVDPQDFGVMRGRGMQTTDRSTGVRSPSELSDEGPITVGGLTLMDEPAENAEKRARRNEREFARRFVVPEQEKIQRHIEANPGSEYKVERSS